MKDNGDFIKDLETTDVRSIVDINYFKEINEEFPKALESIDNEVVYIYGERDSQKNNVSHLTSNYIQIDGAKHNVFSSKPKKLMEKLLELLI